MSNKIKKIIITDLDGTLLRSNRRVSFKTRKYLRKLNKSGNMVVLSSGRPWRSIKSIYRQIGCYGPVIAYNGSYVFHPKDKTFVPFYKPFPKEVIKSIWEGCKDVAGSFMCESLDTVFVNKKDPYLNYYFWYKGMKMKKGDIGELLHTDPVTCIILRPSEEDKIVDDACSKYKGISLRHWTDSLYGELYIEDVDKGTALLYLMDKLGIKKEDVIGFGDADNDFSFLTYCGHPFAMKNSRAQMLLDTFPITKKDNNHDGVIFELKNLIEL